MSIHQPCVILKPHMVNMHPSARVDSFCKLEGGEGVNIGKFVHIASFSHINVGGGSVTFGDYSGCSSHCSVGSATPDWCYLQLTPNSPVSHRKWKYRTVIGRFAVLFMGVIVLPGVTVGEGAIVKAGSVVWDDVEPWTVVQGNPAKAIGIRNLYEDSRSLYVQEFSELSGEILRPDGELQETIGEVES